MMVEEDFAPFLNLPVAPRRAAERPGDGVLQQEAPGPADGEPAGASAVEPALREPLLEPSAVRMKTNEAAVLEEMEGGLHDGRVPTKGRAAT